MKKLARVILKNAVSHFPKTQLELGQGMLAELEEMQGIEALVWAFGGLEMLVKLHGGTIMKNVFVAIGMMSVIAISSWIYVSGHFIISAILLGVSLIVFVAIQPKNAIWFALTMATILPVTYLAQTYMLVRNDLTLIESEINKIKEQKENDVFWITIDNKDLTNIQTGNLIGVKLKTDNKTKLGIATPDNSTETLMEMTNKTLRRFDRNTLVRLTLFGIPIALGLMLVTLFTRQRFQRPMT